MKCDDATELFLSMIAGNEDTSMEALVKRGDVSIEVMQRVNIMLEGAALVLEYEKRLISCKINRTI